MKNFAQSIVETAHHPLVILDTCLRVQSANRRFYQTFGFRSEDTEGRSLFDLGNGQWDISILRELLSRVAAHREPFEAFEVERDFPGIGQKVMLLSSREVHHKDGTRVVLLAIEDVTAKKQSQAELIRLNMELETRVRLRTEQLETAAKEMEAFCYSVSHDLRAPLRAIDGFSRELLNSYGPRFDDQGRHYLERVRSASQRMAQLIDDLLNLSRLARTDMRTQQVDLSSIAALVRTELQRQEPQRDVRFDIQAGLTACGDPGLLRLVIDNLFDNAWKFTSKRDHANISFRKTICDGQPVFYVSDDGAGFDMRFADKLFGAFQRLHKEREFPGTGIGLATVQRIIRRHGGKIWAESTIERGATFYFTLPEGDEPCRAK